jgi:hypothetical protein
LGPFRYRAALAAAILVAGVLAGCGSDDGDDLSTTQAEDTLQADEEAVAAEESPVVAGDGSVDAGADDEADSGATEADDVRQTFVDFQQLVLTADADGALALLTPSAEAWADQILIDTLDADETALTETLPLSSGAAITLFRAAFPTDDLLALDDGVDLLRAASDEGILASIIILVRAGEVTVDGDEAFFVDGGGQRTVRFERSGSDEWRIDLPFALETLLDDNEESILTLFAQGDGAPVTKAEFYDQWVSGFGKTFADVNQPLR